MPDPVPAPAPPPDPTGVLSPDQVQAALRNASADSLATADLAPSSARTLDLSASRLGRVPAPAPDARDEQGKPFGRYRLLVEVGRGGMGVVWKAWDTQLRRIVALKLILSDGGITPMQSERFLREARLAAKLRHPGIVGVLDVGREGDQPYFTTEFIEGRSLDEAMKQEVAPRQAAVWAREIADSLAYAHENGVVHRDVKPGNVLLDASGRTFVMDFGLAKEVDLGGGEASSALRLTVSGSLVGTPQYMSPEQASGEPSRIGPASDQFSLGAVLYEMLTRRGPFDGNGLREVLNAIAELDPIPIRRLAPKVDRDLETICAKALEKDPSRRYATMRNLAVDLDRWIDGEGISARPISLAGRVVRRARKNRAATAASVAAFVLAIVGAGLWVHSELRRGRDVHAAQARADAEVLARTTADKAARDRAMAAQATAETALAKGGRVQNVLARWLLLSDTLSSMERAWYDSTRDEAERRRRAMKDWPRVEEFLSETPADATSQATARAFAGWTRLLCGNADGRGMYDESRRLDPDLPYGDLLEAFSTLSVYLAVMPIPQVTLGPTGPQPGATPPESALAREMHKTIETRLDAASEARIWGQGMADDLRKVAEAIRALAAGKAAEAEAGLTASLGSAAIQPFRTDILLARAKMRYLLCRFAEAQGDLDQVKKARPDCGEVYYFRGVVAQGEGMAAMAKGEDWHAAYRRGVEEYSQCILLVPGCWEAFNARAVLERALGDAEKAMGDLDRAVELYPRDVATLVNRGVAKEAKGDHAGAIQDYSAAIAVDAGCAAAYGNRGSSKHAAGDLDGAMEDYTKAVTLAPDLAQGWYNRGLLHEDRGDAKGAEADYGEAIARAPAFFEALLKRGTLRESQGDLAGALSDLDRAVSLRPKSADALFERGYVKQATHDEDGALADYTAAIEANPSCAEAYVNRAGVKRAKGDAAGALADLDEALRQRPGWDAALYNRGNALYDLGRTAEAKEGYDAALAANPKYVEAWHARAGVRALLGDVDGAIADTEQMLKLMPANHPDRPKVELELQKLKSRGR